MLQSAECMQVSDASDATATSDVVLAMLQLKRQLQATTAAERQSPAAQGYSYSRESSGRPRSGRSRRSTLEGLVRSTSGSLHHLEASLGGVLLSVRGKISRRFSTQSSL